MTVFEIVVVTVFGIIGVSISGYSIYKMIRDFSLRSNGEVEYEMKLSMSRNLLEEIEVIVGERESMLSNISKLAISRKQEVDITDEFVSLVETDRMFVDGLKKSVADIEESIKIAKIGILEKIEVVEELNEQLSGVLAAQYLLNDELENSLSPNKGESYEI
jgi:hypothetical protein